MNERREYQINIVFNKRAFVRVIIDPHYEENHSTMTDELILELVKAQDGKEQEASTVRDGFHYFKIVDRWQNKLYRIILTYCEDDFIGVINVFRVKGDLKNE